MLFSMKFVERIGMGGRAAYHFEPSSGLCSSTISVAVIIKVIYAFYLVLLMQHWSTLTLA